MLLSKSVRKWANKKSPAASCDRALSNLYIFNEVYTYEHCSLTTVGVVTGATTNMYLLTLFSLSFVILWGQI